MEKPIPTGLVLISAIFFFIITMLLSSMAVAAGSGSTTSGAQELGLYYFPAATASSSWCNGGSIEECMMKMREDEEDDEDEGLEMMDSESNRRIMYGRRRYISYGVLYRDRVPCSRRGYSYYNCRPGRPVNPYVRGCNAITRCRSF